MDQALFIVGINHRSATVALRERLAFAEDEIVAALGRMKQSCPAVAEAALISTCNRVEVVGVAADSARAADETLKFLSADRKVDHDAFAEAIYNFSGRDAARSGLHPTRSRYLTANLLPDHVRRRRHGIRDRQLRHLPDLFDRDRRQRDAVHALGDDADRRAAGRKVRNEPRPGQQGSA